VRRRKWLISDVRDRSRNLRPNGPRAAAAVVAAVSAALLAAAVAGCGSGGSEGSTSTSASVSTTAPTSSDNSTTTTRTSTQIVQEVNHPPTPAAAVKLLLLSSNPRTGCSGDVVTSHYLQAAYGGRAGCVKALSPSSAAKSLGTGTADVRGDKATVIVHPVGGIYDGEKITVSLVHSNFGWQVDGIKSNAPVGP
jgi:hypothetical protein